MRPSRVKPESLGFDGLVLTDRVGSTPVCVAIQVDGREEAECRRDEGVDRGREGAIQVQLVGDAALAAADARQHFEGHYVGKEEASMVMENPLDGVLPYFSNTHHSTARARRRRGRSVGV